MKLASYWRAALVLLGLLGVGALLTYARWTPREEGAELPTTAVAATSASCRQCHAAVWQEWETSLHSQAFSHPNVQAAFRHFGHDRQCESCHAAEPILRDLAAPVVLRSRDRDMGVDCLTCHALPDGSMAARRTIANAPCRPIATPALTASLHCGRCHTAIHKDWEASSFRDSGKNCQSCHMPEVQTRPGGRSHLCLGGHDDALVRSGATLNCRIDGDEVVVTVANHATGHNYPGERHNRVLLVQMIERTSDGEITLAEQRTIKDMTPFRGESSAEKIRAGEEFTARFPIVAPAAKAEIQLLYKLFPFYADRDALVVHSAELALP